MARRKKVKLPIPTFVKGDLVKLIPLTPDHINAHLIPPGTVGVVLSDASVPDAAEPDERWQVLEVQFFIMQKPVTIYAAWLVKVDYM